MYDLIYPNITEIIKDVFKRDTGQDCEIVQETQASDYWIFVNNQTKARYLVQSSAKYDLFGMQDWKPDYPQVDAYIYVGPMYIFIQFAGKLVSYFGKFGNAASDANGRLWTSSLMLFQGIGGIIYDYRKGELVDKDIEK
jgi:hypothetical protein